MSSMALAKMLDVHDGSCLLTFDQEDPEVLLHAYEALLGIPPSRTMHLMAGTSGDKTDPAFPLSIEGLDKYIEYASHEDGLSNSCRAKVDLPAGSLICYITAHSPASDIAWSTVHTGNDHHIELNSALTYLNHHCDPNVELHIFSPDENGQYPREMPYDLPAGEPKPTPGPNGIAGELRVVKERSLRAGEDLCFFYPSTEWDCARPFECLCGASKDVCLGWYGGAQDVSREKLEKYFINSYIWDRVV